MKLGKHRVMVKEPHPGSMASLVLLSKDCEKAERRKWLDFRDELLDEAEERDGQLVCTDCGQDGLIRQIPDGKFRQPANLATIDHVIPVSKGGPRFERSNCAIVCYPCNQSKKDKMPV